MKSSGGGAGASQHVGAPLWRLAFGGSAPPAPPFRDAKVARQHHTRSHRPRSRLRQDIASRHRTKCVLTAVVLERCMPTGRPLSAQPMPGGSNANDRSKGTITVWWRREAAASAVAACRRELARKRSTADCGPHTQAQTQTLTQTHTQSLSHIQIHIHRQTLRPQTQEHTHTHTL